MTNRVDWKYRRVFNRFGVPRLRRRLQPTLGKLLESGQLPDRAHTLFGATIGDRTADLWELVARERAHWSHYDPRRLNGPAMMAFPELIANSPVPGTLTAITTLNGAINTTPASGTQENWTFVGGPPSDLAQPGQFHFIVDNEILLDVTGGAGTSRQVLRGQEGSTVTTHASGSSVYHYVSAQALRNVAIQNAFPAATVTIASVNAPTQQQEASTFICDGVTDQLEVNSGVNALPSVGGLVLLSEGTFNINTPIIFQKDHAALQGLERGTTIINVGAGFSGASAITCNQDGLGASIRPCEYIEVGDFTINGNQIGTQSTTDGVIFKAFRSRLHDILVHDCNGAGVRLRGVTAAERLAAGGANVDWSTYGTELDDLKIYQNGNCGIIADAASTDAGIGKCEVFNNAGAGINVTAVLNWIGPRCYIFQNFDQSVAGGSTQGAGILIQTTTGRMMVVSNKIEQNRGGIAFIGGSAFMVTANMFTANSNGEDQTATEFTPNMPSGWIIADTSNTNRHSDIEMIGVSGAPTSVVIIGNIINPNVGGAYAGDESKYAISFVSGTKVIIRDNDLEPGTVGIINNGVGGGNIFAIGGNCGYVTEASGTATITAAATSVVVTHGLSVTPLVQDIALTLSAMPTNAIGELTVDTIGSTTFTIHCRNVPGVSTAVIGWSVQTHRFS